jgi:hypothetical protein
VLANNPRAGALMPVFRSVSTTMLRERQATFPPLPKRRTDIVIPQELQVTNTGQQFVLHCAVNNDFIIFATDSNLRQLCSAPLVTMDGTFDMAPRFYCQIFTLHSFEDKHLVPLVYVLMSKKTQAMYSAIFAQLKWGMSTSWSTAGNGRHYERLRERANASCDSRICYQSASRLSFSLLSGVQISFLRSNKNFIYSNNIF